MVVEEGVSERAEEDEAMLLLDFSDEVGERRPTALGVDSCAAALWCAFCTRIMSMIAKKMAHR